MSRWALIIIAVCTLKSVCANDLSGIERLERQNVGIVRSVRDLMLKLFGGEQETLLGDKLQRQIPAWRPFPCPVHLQRRTERRARSVHELTLGDIDVVSALGDSLSVGSASGAVSLLQALIEYRGLSWSAGHQTSPAGREDSWRRYLTLPNILSQYNYNLTGGATGTSHYWHEASAFNVAEHAAYSRELPGMARRLVERMRNSKRIDMKRDWKMVTVMIGSNNLGSEICGLKNPEGYIKTYKEEILNTLRYLRDHLPRTFVNLVPPPDTDLWTSVRHGNAACELNLRLSFTCLFSDHLRAKRAKYKRIQDDMYEALRTSAETDEFRNLAEFAVVLQPFTKNLANRVLANGWTDLSPLAIDCLHLSQLGNARFALSLFKNLLQPPGRKQTTWEVWERGHVIEHFGNCGAEWGPYIKTYDNS